VQEDQEVQEEVLIQVLGNPTELMEQQIQEEVQVVLLQQGDLQVQIKELVEQVVQV
jgi:hypothetical protein